MDQKTMVPVPLPTEIPEPPNLDKIPLDILHSATVEMLIQQNEDLSSRLKVNIRRNSQLEQKIIELDKSIRGLERDKETIKAQNDIILEKEKLWSEQKEQKDRQLQNSNKEMDLLNLRYSELYASSQQTRKQQQIELVAKQKQIDSLKNKLAVLHKIRERAKEKLRLFLIETAENIYKDQTAFKKNQSSNRILSKQFEAFKDEVSEKEQLFRETLKNFKEQTEKQRMAMQSRIEETAFKNEQLQTDKENLRTELKELTLLYMEEKRNRAKIATLTQELDSARNDNISIKRELSTAFETSEESRHMEVAKNKSMNKEIKNLELQMSEQKKVLDTCESKLLDLSKDNKELSEQLESIQKLWIEAQDKLEKEELKRQNLERINRELSQQYNDNKVERATSKAQESVNAIDAETNSNISEKLGEVYKSQYTRITKAPEMDV